MAGTGQRGDPGRSPTQCELRCSPPAKHILFQEKHGIRDVPSSLLFRRSQITHSLNISGVSPVPHPLPTSLGNLESSSIL